MGGGDSAIIPIVGAYSEQVTALKEINSIGRFYKTDYEFAEELFNVPMAKRETWLDNKINNSGIQDIGKITKLNKFLDKLIGGFQ
jgi:hypothetical protein